MARTSDKVSGKLKESILNTKKVEDIVSDRNVEFEKYIT